MGFSKLEENVRRIVKMKSKGTKFAALLLSAVLLLTGIGPVKKVEAAGKPQFTIRTSAAATKPGDEITAEVWLEPGSEVTSFVFNFVYDNNVYECTKRTRGELGEDATIDADPGSISILCDFDDPVTNGGKIYTFTLKVRENASGSGNIGLDFKGATEGTGEDAPTIPAGNENADISVKDENGNTIPDGDIAIEVSLQSLTLNKTAPFTMTKGANDTLTVTAVPEGALTGKTVTWTSSDNNVVSVDADGNIHAVGGGKATITASAAGKSASVEITVIVPLNGISLNKDKFELPKGLSETLNVVYDPTDATEDKAVTWTSDDASIAAVDANGKITGVKAGTTTINATTAKGLKASCEVTVIEIPLTGIEIDSSNPAVMYKGQSRKINVALVPSNTTDRDVEFTYSSSDEKIVTVDKDGTLHALKEGEAEITVTTADGKFTAKYALKVEEIPLKGIAFENEVNPLEVGKTAQLKILFNPANTTDDKTITWSSSDKTVATVENGLLKGLKPGKTTITAKVGEKEISYELTVTEKKSAVSGQEDKNSQANKSGKSGTVNTGDASNILAVLMVMLLSLSVIAVLTLDIRRRKKRMHRR